MANVTFGEPRFVKPEVKSPSEVEKTDVQMVMYETDGHYSTVYLVCLMLGVSEENALELAIATENPDTDVHSETDFELDDTWSDAEYQESIHPLTGGFMVLKSFLRQ